MALTAIHPGEHLAEELKALNMSAAELARKLKVPTNRVTQILNGPRAVTGDTALRLSHFFGTSAEFWRNFGRICRVSTSCAWRRGRRGSLSKLFPDSSGGIWFAHDRAGHRTS
jgi:antitoxin HigA-1